MLLGAIFQPGETFIRLNSAWVVDMDAPPLPMQ